MRVTVASDHRNALAEGAPGATLTLDLDDLEGALRTVRAFHRERPIRGVVAAEDEGVRVAAAVAGALGLRGNPVPAAETCRRKDLFREALSRAGVRSPRHRVIDDSVRADSLAGRVSFPCVVKPLSLSASRGVVRADDVASLERAIAEAGEVVRAAAPAEGDGSDRSAGSGPARLLVEDYVPGEEVALEGLLEGGRLRTLALLDKPDPLTGPYFEETMFVTPSRLPEERQDEVAEVVARVAEAVGLREGPVHAELRLNEEGIWPIELAPRTIGGLCGRLFRFRTGTALEELVLRHALGRRIPDVPAHRASGAFMIPIPRPGRFLGLEGVDRALELPEIVDVALTAHRGQRLEAAPRGNRYLGFIFARSERAEDVEGALREAHSRLRVRIE